MVKVKYVGPKPAGMPVQFPIGAKNKSNFTQVKMANPFLELSDEEADLLISLNAHCGSFEIAAEKGIEKASKKAEKGGLIA